MKQFDIVLGCKHDKIYLKNTLSATKPIIKLLYIKEICKVNCKGLFHYTFGLPFVFSCHLDRRPNSQIEHGITLHTQYFVEYSL